MFVMAKGIIISDQEVKIKKLEDKIKELEQANLMLQEYFSKTSDKLIKAERSTPFSGIPKFSGIFNFTIDLDLQKVIWLNAINDFLGFNEEKLFLKSIDMLSSKLILTADRRRFKNIINQFRNSGNPHQTVLRLKHPEKKFIWVLACFEKESFNKQTGSYLQIQFTKLEENKEVSDLLYEFIKKTEKGDQYHKVELLTGRQREILVLLGKGYTSKEIAECLNISFHTVEAHRKSIAKKTQTRKRAALISLAAEVGIVR
jgi:DNA-binding CsgD family transcriptional regulator